MSFIVWLAYVSMIQVNENGVISFDKVWKFGYPERFPTDFFWTRQGLAVAPFWSDNDIRKEGTVRYASYCTIPLNEECSFSSEEQEIMDMVNRYIQDNQDVNEDRFEGNWLLVAHWDHVHPSPHGEEDHNGIPQEELDKVWGPITVHTLIAGRLNLVSFY